jgi:hypothetical protein
MTLLLKPRGKDPDSVYGRLMSDWKQVEDAEWAVRPIAAGNAHGRLINRARLCAIVEDFFAEEFVSEDIVQLAFGTKRGAAVACSFPHADYPPEFLPRTRHGTV